MKDIVLYSDKSDWKLTAEDDINDNFDELDIRLTSTENLIEGGWYELQEGEYVSIQPTKLSIQTLSGSNGIFEVDYSGFGFERAIGFIINPVYDYSGSGISDAITYAISSFSETGISGNLIDSNTIIADGEGLEFSGTDIPIYITIIGIVGGGSK